MTRLFLGIATILGGTSVAAGAFASHALKAQLSQRAIDIFETGAKYQMYHALALLAVALLFSRAKTVSRLLGVAGFAFIIGTALFSGSLYTLSLTGIEWLGAITPFGGVAFLIGWGCLGVAAFAVTD